MSINCNQSAIDCISDKCVLQEHSHNYKEPNHNKSPQNSLYYNVTIMWRKPKHTTHLRTSTWQPWECRKEGRKLGRKLPLRETGWGVRGGRREQKISIYLLWLTLCLPDIDECSLQTHTCWNDSVCVNLPGGYDCVCTSGPGCSGDCPQEEGLRRNGEDWKPSFDRCAICSCKVEKQSNMVTRVQISCSDAVHFNSIQVC